MRPRSSGYGCASSSARAPLEGRERALEVALRRESEDRGSAPPPPSPTGSSRCSACTLVGVQVGASLLELAEGDQRLDRVGPDRERRVVQPCREEPLRKLPQEISGRLEVCRARARGVQARRGSCVMKILERRPLGRKPGSSRPRDAPRSTRPKSASSSALNTSLPTASVLRTGTARRARRAAAAWSSARCQRPANHSSWASEPEDGNAGCLRRLALLPARPAPRGLNEAARSHPIASADSSST